MTDLPATSAIEALRRAIAEKSSQLSELDLMLADYDAERAQLIRELRHLQVQLRDTEEHLQASLKCIPAE